MSGTAVSFGAEADEHRLDFSTRVGAAISFAAPFAVVIGHAATGSVWRDDLVVLRGLGWVGLGRTGAVSALFAQAAFYVPLGSVHFRLALMAAVVLGAAGCAVYAFTRDVLARQAESPLLTDALATIAALTATLSATAQEEGALAGGGGAALLLAATILATRPADALGSRAHALYLGMLGGALVAESGLTAIVLGVGIALAFAVGENRPDPRATLWALGGGAASLALLVSPAILRRFAPAPFLDIDRAIDAMHATLAVRPFGGALSRLRAEGPFVLALAAVGLALALARREIRVAAVPLVAIIAFYAISVFGEGRLFSTEEVAPLHLAAGAALASGAALAVQAIAAALFAWRLPMASGATILLVMTDLTLAVATAEEASFASDRSAWRGAEAFTDEAFETLPPRAALLVRSRAVAWRLWAAQLAHGARSDVIVVPVPAAGDARLAMRLLRTEPALQKVLQDISLEGRPGEEALTILADARPVFVELDPGWDRRIFTHFVPDHLWLRFSPEPRGPSDRKAAFVDLRARADRVHQAARLGDSLDPDTSTVLRARLVDGAVAAALLGDREEAMSLASRIGDIPGGGLFSAELMQRLLATKSGPVDARPLLR